MAWAHINMLGEYDFADEKLRDSVGILPLKSAASGTTKSRRAEDVEISVTSGQCAKSCGT